MVLKKYNSALYIARNVRIALPKRLKQISMSQTCPLTKCTRHPRQAMEKGHENTSVGIMWVVKSE